jgi:hypothetical protein
MENQKFKGVLAGLAGGMVAAWAVTRFYHMARASSRTHSVVPYLVGAGLGATYVGIIQTRDVPLVARVPLGAAVWLGEPEKTAAPPKGGRDLSEKAQNLAMRLASRGLKKAAERALFA